MTKLGESQEHFDNLARKAGIPVVFGYYAWLLNEGVGSGEDIISSAVELKESAYEEGRVSRGRRC